MLVAANFTRPSNFRVSKSEKTVFNILDVAEHAAARRMIQHCFTEEAIRAASTFVIKNVDRWHELLLEEVDRNKDA